MLSQSLQAAAVRGLEVVGKLALYLLAAWFLGAVEAGMFFVCATWAHLVSTTARMGVDRAIMRHIAAELGVQNIGAARRDLTVGLAIVGPAAIGAGAATWLMAAFLASAVFSMPDLGKPLALTALLIIPQCLAIYFCSALTGFGRTILSQLLQFAFWPFAGIAALFAGFDTAAGLVAALSIGLLVVAIVSGVLVAREMIGRSAPVGAALQEKPVDPLPPIWKTARPLLLVEIVQVSIANLPVLILATMVGEALVGAFSLAMRISMIVWMVIISLGTIAAPSFAQFHRRSEFSALASLNRRIMMAGLMMGGTAALMTFIFAGPLLALFGPEFRIATTALMLLAAGQFFNAYYCCQDVLLAMSGHGRLLSRINILQLLTGIALMLALVPPLAIEGAALAVAVVTALGALATSMSVRVLMGSVANPGVPILPGFIRRRVLESSAGGSQS